MENRKIYDQVKREIYDKVNHHGAPITHHRETPLTMFELKGFDESLRESRRSLGQLPNLANGGTTDGEAILTTAKRLMARKTGKRIMLVLCDGEPSYAVGIGRTSDYTKRAVQVCMKMGIHMIGIGILLD